MGADTAPMTWYGHGKQGVHSDQATQATALSCRWKKPRRHGVQARSDVLVELRLTLVPVGHCVMWAHIVSVLPVACDRVYCPGPGGA